MAQGPMWSAVRLQPHRERLALAELTRAGYDVYCPRILHRRIAKGRKIETHPPLFPGYAFVAIVLQWYSAHYAPGVIGLLMDGERPTRVPDAVIDELKSRERNGIIALPRKPEPGFAFRSMSVCGFAPAHCVVCSGFMPAWGRAIGSWC
jgi:transcription antitermination factor NusG